AETVIPSTIIIVIAAAMRVAFPPIERRDFMFPPLQIRSNGSKCGVVDLIEKSGGSAANADRIRRIYF
ncbi:MAG TPA: hypothetical protein DEP46_10775, partial [Blastocatellia bacterium]|nr:hypothetical protein [Blastocatellia bacterium]